MSQSLEESKLSEDEKQIKTIIDKSKMENDYQEEMRKKNDELLGLMKQIEDGKPKQGWGVKAKKDIEGDEFNHYQENLHSAIQKLELHDHDAKRTASE